MRDNSPTREPGIDAERRPPVEIFEGDRCAACGTEEKLGVYRDWILCAECEDKDRRGYTE